MAKAGAPCFHLLSFIVLFQLLSCVVPLCLAAVSCLNRLFRCFLSVHLLLGVPIISLTFRASTFCLIPIPPPHPLLISLLTDSYSKTRSSIFPTQNPSATDLGLIKDTVEVNVCFPSVYLHQHCRKVRPEPGKQRQRENKHQDAIVPTNAQTNKNIKLSDSSH